MIFTTSQTDQDLTQILDLQKKNLTQSLSQEEISREGFVTVNHSVEVLKKMNYPDDYIETKKDHLIV